MMRILDAIVTGTAITGLCVGGVAILAYGAYWLEKRWGFLGVMAGCIVFAWLVFTVTAFLGPQ